MNKWIVSGLCIVGMASPALAQVPVTDAAANFQLVKSYFQEIKGYALQGQQYLTQAQQLAQEVQTYYSFVQNPTLGAAVGLMYRTGLANDLPINPAGLMGLTSGYSMSLSSLSGKLSALSTLSNTSYEQAHVYECTNAGWACTQQKQRAFGLAGTSGIAQAAYQNLREHIPIVQALRDRAATATTPAERENILIAMQSEQAWHNNLMGQVQAAEMQARVDEGNLVQRDNERTSQNIEAVIAQIPGG